MEGRNFSRRRWILLFLAAVVLLCLLRDPTALRKLLRKTGQVFLPFGLGLGMAVLLNVPLSFLEQRIFAQRKVSRIWTLGLTCLFWAGIMGALLFCILPQLQVSSARLAAGLPEYLARLETGIQSRAARLGPRALAFVRQMETGVQEWLRKKGESGRMLESTVNAAAGLLKGAGNLLAGTVFSVYLLAKKEALGRSCRRVLTAFLPEKTAETLADIGGLTARTFHRFVTGQLTEAMILGLLCFLGMTLFRFPYALLISAIIGVTALVPVFGAVFGTLAGALVLLTEKPLLAVWFILFIVVLQQIETNFIYPRVVGESIGLPGIWVLAAVTAGGSAFGFLGVLAGIPLTAVGYTLFRELVARRIREKENSRQKDVV